MDYAKIHHSKEFIKNSFSYKIRIVYNAHYSPKLNPFKSFFYILKLKFRYLGIIIIIEFIMKTIKNI